MIVRRDDQPPERGIASLGPPIGRERAIKLAEKVFRPYADRIIKPDTDREARSRALEVAAEIDPDGAWRKCQAGEAPWDSNPVRIAAVRYLADVRPQDAEAIIPTIKNDFWRQSMRIELIDALPPGARDRKLALLDEAAQEACETSDVGNRVYHVNETIKRLIDLGRRTTKRDGCWTRCSLGRRSPMPPIPPGPYPRPDRRTGPAGPPGGPGADPGEGGRADDQRPAQA